MKYLNISLDIPEWVYSEEITELANTICNDPELIGKVYEQLVINIQRGIKGKRKEVKICELNSSGYFVSLEKENWVMCLKKVKIYYLKQENFEVCVVINNLLSKLRNERPKN